MLKQLHDGKGHSAFTGRILKMKRRGMSGTSASDQGRKTCTIIFIYHRQ